MGALCGLEYFRCYVYGKRVNLQTDHQAHQPFLKQKRAHKQYSARLTCWLSRWSHFDVNVQNTAGKNIPLTDYLNRHPIVPTELTELENKADGLNETEAEEEFVINQIYGLFEFNQTRGSIGRFTEQAITRETLDQSQGDKNIREQNQNNHSFKTSSLPKSSDSNALVKTLPSSTSKMDKINGIDINFIYKTRGFTPETKRPWFERNHILIKTRKNSQIKPALWEKVKKVNESKNIDRPKMAAKNRGIKH